MSLEIDKENLEFYRSFLDTSIIIPKSELTPSNREVEGEKVSVLLNNRDELLKHKEFIIKIFSSVKIKEEEIGFHFIDIKTDKIKKYNNIVVFTSNNYLVKEHLDFISKIEKYQPTKNIVWADDLDQIASNQPLKLALWNSLKALFGI